MADAKDPGRSSGGSSVRRARWVATAGWVVIVLLLINSFGGTADPPTADQAATLKQVHHSLGELFPAERVMAALFLLCCSAFFSATEVAYFSLHKIRIRAMRESDQVLDRLAAKMLDHPGNLLTTILMGNSMVNVLISIVIAPQLEEFFAQVFTLPTSASYIIAVILSTAILVTFGEIMPKVIVVWRSESYARFAAAPIYLVDRVLAPLRNVMIGMTGLIFRLTRFSRVASAPFMTDEEFVSLLSDGEAVGVIEEDERRMIEGILESSDIMVREILIPRPDVVAMSEDAEISDALATLRESEYARVPVYRGNLDHITGVLYMKDLLPSVALGKTDLPIKPLLRKPLFVPETMTAADFIKTAQRMHMHIAVVVDEYGGTEGIVTLQDALREMIGEIGDEALEQQPPYELVGEGLYRVEGNLSLDDLQQLTGAPVEDEEHTTVAGFLMDLSEKVLQEGDRVEHAGVEYLVERVEKKRVAQVLIKVPSRPSEGEEK